VYVEFILSLFFICLFVVSFGSSGCCLLLGYLFGYFY